MEKLKNMFNKAKSFCKELFQESSASAFTGAFITTYYTYLGVWSFIVSGFHPMVFFVFLLPALVGLCILCIDAWCWSPC